LLAADFTSNQTRVLSFFDSSGALIGQPVVLVNSYLLSGAPPSAPGAPRDPGSSPRTFSWNVVLEHQVRKNLNLRASFLDSHTVDLFFLDPVLNAAGGGALLALKNTAVSQYHQADITAHYRPGERADMSLSYTWSRGRGDLNPLSDTLVPFQVPVIRPNVRGILSSDVPHRVVASGFFRLPWKMVISPVADVHSGLPFSNVDVLQNYVGVPDDQRFPFRPRIGSNSVKVPQLPRLCNGFSNRPTEFPPMDQFGSVSREYTVAQRHRPCASALAQYGSQDLHCLWHNFDFHRRCPQNLSITMEHAWPVGGELHTLGAPSFHA